MWNTQTGHILSRVHEIDSPIPLAKTLCPMPSDLSRVDLDFARVLDGVADQCCRKIDQKNQTPFLFYSGGIDSVSMLVAILRNASADFLRRLVVVCNQFSIWENPYFYDRFIKDKLITLDTDKFTVDLDRLSSIAILDGEMGNQALGAGSNYDYVRKGCGDMLSAPYHTVFDEKVNAADKFMLEQVVESMRHAPIKIENLHDFIWWCNFNFKADDVLLRKILVYTDTMTAEQRRDFYHNNIVRFYAHPDMQVWSLASNEIRHRSLKITTKYHPKKYIFDFDHNDFWFKQKHEMGSMAYIFAEKGMGNFVFGLDEDWALQDLRDRHARQWLGKYYPTPRDQHHDFGH